MGKIKEAFKKTIIAFLLLFVGLGLHAQDINLEKTIGFIVTPKDYKIFKNEGDNFDLNTILTDENIEWSGKKKAFGMYAFNLQGKRSGFFIGDRLVGTGEIVSVNDFDGYIIIAVITEYKGRSLLVKYFISTSNENEIDFACWWYDEEIDSIIGEVSEKIKVEFIDED